MAAAVGAFLRRRWRTVLVGLAGLSAAGVVSAEPPTPASPPDEGAPPQEAAPPDLVPPTPAAPTPPAVKPAENATAPEAPKTPPPAAATASTETTTPPEPPKPLRSPAAIIQALDKVTAETIRFEVPVGKRIRYKTLVFQVRACETTGLDDPQPQSAAYLIVDSQPQGIAGHAPPPSKQVFKGWMYATAPGLHLLEHPVYDAWLIACSASSPAA